MMSNVRRYSELCKLATFDERFDYLSLGGKVGEETFGFDRYLNQVLYRSKEWRELRNHIVVRDNGCEMGLEDFPINGRVIVHHMNPISLKDIDDRIPEIMDPEYLITVSHDLHNAIHYGNKDILKKYTFAERFENDTCPWR